jgi:DnaA family protein
MQKNSPTIQLFLPVQTRLEKSFENYLGGANSGLISCLQDYIKSKDEPLIILVGAESVGKTHLLSSAIQYFESHFGTDSACAYFSLSELSEKQLSENYYADLLDYFETFSFLALDDVDLWLNSLSVEARHDAEMLLFNIFNHYKMNGKLLLIASKCPPSRLNIELKDLESRLQSGLLLTISELDDAGKNELIRSLAKLKGFLMDDDVSAFILKRSGRDVLSLLGIIDTLDKATLIEKRRLTVPFVKKILNW